MWSRPRAPVLAVLLTLAACPAFGQTTVLTWANSATNNIFTDSNSWVVQGSTATSPPSLTTLVRFGGSAPVQPQFATSASVLGLVFESTAGSYTIPSQATQTPSGVTLTVGASGIVSGSSAAQFISVPVIFSSTVAAPIQSNSSGQVSLSGAVTVGSGGLVFGGTGLGGGVVSGSLSSSANTAGKIAVAAGNWTFSGNNGFAGPVEITGGRLVLGSSGALPAGKPIALNPAAQASATLEVGSQLSASVGPISFGGSGASSLVIGTGVTLALSGDVIYNAGGVPGTASISGGALSLGSSNRVFRVEDSASDTDLSISSSITGSAGLIKQGAGSLTLSSSSNQFSGSLTINQGSVVLGLPGALPAGAAVSVDAFSGQEAALRLSGASQTISSLTLGASSRPPGASNSVEVGVGAVLSVGSATSPGQLTVYGNGAKPSARIGDSSLLDIGQLSFPSGGSINVLRNTTALASSVDLEVRTSLVGSGAVQKSGAGTLLLAGSGELLTGTLQVGQGVVLFGNGFAPSAGTSSGGMVGVSSGATIAAARSGYLSESVIGKGVTLESGAILGSWEFDQATRLKLSGQVTLQPATNSLALSVGLGGSQETVISGTLTSSVQGTVLTLLNQGSGSRGLLAITGVVDSSIGTISVDGAGLILSGVPANTTLSSSNGGYIGVAPGGAGGPAPALQAVMDKVPSSSRASFSGTFGLDSLPGTSTPRTYQEALSFVDFGAGVTLGTASEAIYEGQLTPSGNTYAFGNGGGTLILRSNLGDGPNSSARSLSVVSSTAFSDNSLILFLQSANSFTGGITVGNSALVFDAPGAFSAGATSLAIQAGSYVGFTEDAGMGGARGFRSLLNTNRSYALTLDPNGMIGLDSASFIDQKIADLNASVAISRMVADRLDLSSLSPVGFGTSSRVTLLGSLVGAMSTSSRALRLAGVADGVLEVRSRLTTSGAGAVTVGGSSDLAAAGTVILSGQNTYTGGTTLLSGTLQVGSRERFVNGTLFSGPLGLGALTVPAGAIAPSLKGSYSINSVFISNPLLLGSRLKLGSQASWSIPIVLSGIISDLSGAGGLDIYSDTTLKGVSSFSGGVALYSGKLQIGSSSVSASSGSNGPLGTGTFVISSAGENSSRSLGWTGPQLISNAVSLRASSIYLEGSGALTLSGPISLESSVEFETGSGALYLTGLVSGAGGLKAANGNGVIVLNPPSVSNAYTGTVSASQLGRIVFGSAAALPAGSSGSAVLSSGLSGYIGFASTAGAIESDFLARFEKGTTYGTIGLDTIASGGLRLDVNDASSSNLFSQQINLLGFAPSVRLGSASSARLSGDILTPSNEYRFGGGGGWLEVSSPLVEKASLGTSLSVVSSLSSPLTLRLSSGGNNLTGGGNVDSSALIFGNGAIPNSGSYTLSNGGYIGSESVAFGTQLEMNSFLGRVIVGSSSTMVGVDVAPGGQVIPVSSIVDLRLLQGSSLQSGSGVFLGSATQAIFSGPIIPSNSSVYRFAGYKGGQVTIATPLTSGAVEIGDGSIDAFHVNPTNPSVVSTVILSGDNSYAGGTTLSSGQLLLGSATALGTGSLTVGSSGSNLPSNLRLGSSIASSALSISNPILLTGGSLELTGSNGFTLAGPISGFGGVTKSGTGTVTLTGGNSFSGSIRVEQGKLVVGTAASGSESVSLGKDSPTIQFLDSVTLRSLSGDSTTARVEVAAGKTLTVSPNWGTSSYYSYPNPELAFSGSFGPVVPGTSINLVFSGPVVSGAEVPQFRLSGQSSYLGTTTISTGITVLAANSDAFGQSSVSVTGGRLALASGVTLSNPLSLSSGTLAGEGQVNTAATIDIGNGVKLSPGFDLVGTLSFSASSLTGPVLSLNAGGLYQWKIGDATQGSGEWDRVEVVGSVSITASAASPFTVKMMPLGPLGLTASSIAGFDPASAYAWPILSASNISSFSTSAFVVDSSAFSALAPSYMFSVGIESTNLVLNYNPAAVPEPSTWIMLLSGAAAGVAWLRRRRRI